MAKSSKIEVENRIGFIIELYAKGITSTRDILRFASEKYDVTERQIETYIKEARAQIIKSHEPRRDERISTAIMRYEALIALNMDNGDYREARQCQNDLNKLLGLIVEKHEVTSRGTEPFTGFNFPTGDGYTDE